MIVNEKFKREFTIMKRYKKVAIVAGIHLFPYRTEKLSPPTPMVLLYQVGE